MDLKQLAEYLHRDVREVTKLASRGHLPGRKVAGEWRFARAEINHWIETQMSGYSEKQLTAIEQGRSRASEHEEPLISVLLSEATMGVPFGATTRTSALRELVNLAEQSGHVYDPDALLAAVQQREELASTALESGVAISHPRRPLPGALAETVMAYGRTFSGVPFGAPRGITTDVFFLLASRDDPTHLRVLARLSRLLLRPDFVDGLRAVDTPSETWQFIADAEQRLLEGESD
jgi:PTS system nitrogen regulatory IIA component